jgi:hypothetical protein
MDKKSFNDIYLDIKKHEDKLDSIGYLSISSITKLQYLGIIVLIFLILLLIAFILSGVDLLLSTHLADYILKHILLYTIVIFITIILGLLVAKKLKRKKRIIEGYNILYLVIKGIWPKANHLSDVGFSKDEYNAKLFKAEKNGFFSNNLISIDDGKLIFANLISGRFKGVVGKIKLNKNIEGSFAISFYDDDGAKKDFKIDDNEFNSYYNIYVDDNNKVKAMEILTPDVMQKILDKVKATKRYFDFGIEDDVLYFRIYHSLTSFVEIDGNSIQDNDSIIYLLDKDDEAIDNNSTKENRKLLLKEYYNYLLEIKDIIDLLTDIVNKSNV